MLELLPLMLPADLPTRGKRLTHVHVSLPGVGMLRHFTLVQLHEGKGGPRIAWILE
jgi:hypothetical protein